MRADKHQTLVSVRSDRHELEDDLASLEKEQAKIAARLAGVNVQPAGPVKHGSGRFIWPVNGTITSPFGYRWGRLHAGIDIAVPEGTPIRAADGGTVAIAGWTGGYGNYTCINHGGGVSTCYGHQSRIAVSVGQSVSQGQVIGYVRQHRPLDRPAPPLRGPDQRAIRSTRWGTSSRAVPSRSCSLRSTSAR